MQNLIGKNRQEGGRAAQQHGKQIERDGGQNNVPAENEMHSGHQTSPRIRFGPRPGRTRPWTDGQHQQEKGKGAEHVDQVHAGKSNVGNEQTADSRPHDRADLKEAVVPGYRIGEGVTRDERRKKGSARRPTERARHAGKEEQEINQGNGGIVEMKGGMMPFENAGDGRERVIGGADSGHGRNDQMLP